MRKCSLVLFTLSLLFFVANYAWADMPIIKADEQFFDVDQGVHVLRGNVYIEHNGRIVTAGEARTNMIEVWASGSVNFSQADIHFTGNRVYVFFPKSQAEISGSVNFSRTGLKITADKVVYDWNTKIAVFTDNVVIVRNGNTQTADSANYNVELNTIF